MKLLHLVIQTGDINGKLAAFNGKIVVHLANYTILHEQAPVITDSIFQVFKVLVPENILDMVDEGQGPKPRIWVGTKGQRNSQGDMATVEIVPEHAIIDENGNPANVASQAFAAFPREVQVAAVLTNAPDVSAKIEAKSQGDINKWASETLNAFIATQPQ